MDEGERPERRGGRKTMSDKPKLICITGPDGSGKTTQMIKKKTIQEMEKKKREEEEEEEEDDQEK